MSRNHEKAAWYAEGLSFRCQRCGACCGGDPGYVWVSEDEIKRIARHLELPVEQFHARHARRVGLRYSLLELDDGDCEFLIRGADGATGCAIHPVRPLQCRTWPFWDSNLDSRRVWRAAAKQCPGIDRGEHYPLSAIRDCLRRNDEADLPL